MKTIAVASAKGGVGKSTLVVSLAVQAMKGDSRVAILDFEPQGSASLWWVLRGKPANPLLVRDGDPVKEVQRLKKLDLADWVFIDTPAAGFDAIERAVEAADFVLVPVQASVFDLSAVRAVVAMCEEHKKAFAFCLSREHPRRDALNGSALAHLKKMGPVLVEHVQERTVYVSATGLGKTGPEHPDAKQAKEARGEIEPLWAAVKKLAARVR